MVQVLVAGVNVHADYADMSCFAHDRRGRPHRTLTRYSVAMYLLSMQYGYATMYENKGAGGFSATLPIPTWVPPNVVPLAQLCLEGPKLVGIHFGLLEHDEVIHGAYLRQA